jgi:hypothetical protein
VEVIDADLGLSGRSADGRSGFKDLVSRVCLGAWVRTSQGASSDARDRRSRHDHLLFGRETGGRVESKAAKERP